MQYNYTQPMSANQFPNDLGNILQNKSDDKLENLPFKRYSYTNFTGKPYSHYHGIPYQVNDNCFPNNNDRTIIRQNQPTFCNHNNNNPSWAIITPR
ncbi:hypothetical protein qu_638 [Acanthamoeba polyphaga mimivirus]|nr:hypothetical protein HIRU_S334 [Hirudovirus strain Sangsue]QTF49529.1 hypothetical protein [Mimivirus reunion]WMV61972.1 hypothetical protein qu_638 [Mimivirus sp.]WMV62949.1 hypothetical protein qu_638 [Acanthamoeba polyphaga mimivirus]WMV63926.1 hypothetical protein qu_638 [Mimivirus sp.]